MLVSRSVPTRLIASSVRTVSSWDIMILLLRNIMLHSSVMVLILVIRNVLTGRVGHANVVLMVFHRDVGVLGVSHFLIVIEHVLHLM